MIASDPLREALRDWFALEVRTALGDPPTVAEVALVEAAVTAHWRRLGEPSASMAYRDEVRTIHRECGRCFCCGRQGPLHLKWEDER